MVPPEGFGISGLTSSRGTLCVTVAGVGDVAVCPVCFGIYAATQEFWRWFCCCLRRSCVSHFLYLTHLWPDLATICAFSHPALLVAQLARLLSSIC